MMKRQLEAVQRVLQAGFVFHCSASPASCYAEAFSSCHSTIRLDAVIAASIFVVLLSVLPVAALVQTALLILIFLVVLLGLQKLKRTKAAADPV